MALSAPLSPPVSSGETDFWLGQLIEAVPVAAAIVDLTTGAQLSANEAFEQIDALARKWEGHSIRNRLARDAVTLCQNEGRAVRRERAHLGRGVEARDFLIDVTPVSVDPRYALLVLTETTAVAQAARLLRRQMVDDPLTGLPNRAGFVELLDGWLDGGSGTCGVVAINLSQFSRVNDCMGPLGGDELLVTVARRLKSGMREGDTLARTGADEFAVAAQLSGERDLLAVAHRIQATLSEPFRLSDFEIKVDCAVGCALLRESDDAEQAMRHAQLALKVSRTTGGVEVYQPSALASARRRFSIETELRRAVEQGSLDLAYQPLVSLQTGRITGFEALARWTHAQLGEVPPNEFIAVAEDSGLIVPIGRWALERAVSTLKAWDAAAGRALPLTVAVNLSAAQMARDNIGQVVADVVYRHALSGERLTIELTESMLVAEPDNAARILGELKDSAVTIAMDDFGTGYSNLATLKRLPIDVLKIDRSLVSGMMEDGEKVAIVRAIQSLAATLGLSVTAEGVETADVARLLGALGCATGQGYHFARPMEQRDALSFALASGL